MCIIIWNSNLPGYVTDTYSVVWYQRLSWEFLDLFFHCFNLINVFKVTFEYFECCIYTNVT